MGLRAKEANPPRRRNCKIRQPSEAPAILLPRKLWVATQRELQVRDKEEPADYEVSACETGSYVR